MAKTPKITAEQIKAELAAQGWSDISLLYSIAAGEDDGASLCLSGAEEALDVINTARLAVIERMEDAAFERSLK